MGGTCSVYWQNEKCIRNLSRKTRKEVPFAKPKSRWEGSIRMDLEDTGYKGTDWIHLALDKDQFWAVVSTVMNRRVP
jgi:hypothetical protein